jgi:hypothetical protein
MARDAAPGVASTTMRALPPTHDTDSHDRPAPSCRSAGTSARGDREKTGLFSSSIADAGQAKGDRRLVGWVDIDAYDNGKPPAVSVPTST